MVDLLKKHLSGQRYGIPIWVYFLLAIINCLEHSLSHERIGTWAASTILPQLLGIEPHRLNSRRFWRATEDINCCKTLYKKRQNHPEINSVLFVGIKDGVWKPIEQELFVSLKNSLSLSWESVLYETTNFFTYFEEPMRSKLALTGHNKEGRHNKKAVKFSNVCRKNVGNSPFPSYLSRQQSCESKLL